MPHDECWVYPAPLDGWLVFLCDGWRLPFIVEPIQQRNHSRYSILLWRAD